jgi:short-subunit dehydrogenase involved in D-alanine esterification of teichoic acids
VILNAGIQRTVDFTTPTSIDPTVLTRELSTNYTSPLMMVTHFLPHLQSRKPSPTSIVLVTSGLALVPMSRCPNYCATKAAVHSLAWTLRESLTGSESTNHISVVEVIPPAVQTELHSQQPELVKAGQAHIGMPLADCLEQAWEGLEEGLDEVPIGAIRDRFSSVEVEKKRMFRMMADMMKGQGIKG